MKLSLMFSAMVLASVTVMPLAIANNHDHASHVGMTEQAQQYVCPMHPEVVSDNPDDRCPKCGMFLEPISSGSEQHAGHDHANMTMGAAMPAKDAKQDPHANHQLAKKPELSEIVAQGKQDKQDEVIKYVCPMHPHVISDTPGTCPICGMNLEKVSQSASQTEIAVNVSGSMQQALGVRTELVREDTLWKFVNTIGTVEYNENRIGHVHTRVTGWIETLKVHNVGQQVKKGQLLYELYSPELVNAQDDYMQALDYLKQDKKRGEVLLKKARQRLALLGVSEQSIKALEKSGETIYRMPFYAEQDGFISELTIRHGMYVQPGDTLMEIVDQSSVWVIADVFENEQSWLEEGRPVEVNATAQGLFDMESTIEYIYPELDPVTRAMRVRIALNNPDFTLKPGTLVDVKLFGGPKRNVLTIPTEALILTGRENRVVVRKQDNSFITVSVRVGMIAQNKAEILSGLNVGDSVVVSGQFLIDSEASIQGSLQRLSSTSKNGGVQKEQSEAQSSNPHANH